MVFKIQVLIDQSATAGKKVDLVVCIINVFADFSEPFLVGEGGGWLKVVALNERD